MKPIVLTLLCIPVFIHMFVSSDDCTSARTPEVWPIFSACVV
jgi:hypothetical protein